MKKNLFSDHVGILIDFRALMFAVFTNLLLLPSFWVKIIFVVVVIVVYGCIHGFTSDEPKIYQLKMHFELTFFFRC